MSAALPLLPAPLLSFLSPYKASQETAGGSLASRPGPGCAPAGCAWDGRGGGPQQQRQVGLVAGVALAARALATVLAAHLGTHGGALRAPAGRPPWSGSPRGQEGGPSG